MRYREVGTTGLRVSEIAFGTGGNAGLMVAGTFEQQLEAISKAIELGINYFDESPDYGDGISEINLGKVLRELKAEPIITTKVEVRAEDLDDIAGHVERSVDESLTRLGVDHVDIVQIHNGPVAKKPELRGRQYNILGTEDYLGESGALEGLERIQRAGKTRFIGFICRGDDGDQVKHLIDTGKFQLMNIIYTLLNPTAVRTKLPGMEVAPDFGQVIPYGSKRGVGSAIYSPLASGILSDQIISGGESHPLSKGGREGMNEARQRTISRAAQFRFLSEYGTSLAQAATRFILTNPGVTSVLGGFSDAQQVEEIAAASDAGPLPPETIDRIEAVWRNNYTP